MGSTCQSRSMTRAGALPRISSVKIELWPISERRTSTTLRGSTVTGIDGPPPP